MKTLGTTTYTCDICQVSTANDPFPDNWSQLRIIKTNYPPKTRLVDVCDTCLTTSPVVLALRSVLGS